MDEFLLRCCCPCLVSTSQQRGDVPKPAINENELVVPANECNERSAKKEGTFVPKVQIKYARKKPGEGAGLAQLYHRNQQQHRGRLSNLNDNKESPSPSRTAAETATSELSSTVSRGDADDDDFFDGYTSLESNELRQGGLAVKEQLKKVTVEFWERAKVGIRTTAFYNGKLAESFSAAFKITPSMKINVMRLGVISNPSVLIVFHFDLSEVSSMIEGPRLRNLDEKDRKEHIDVLSRTLQLVIEKGGNSEMAQPGIPRPKTVELVFGDIRERRKGFAALSILKIMANRQSSSGSPVTTSITERKAETIRRCMYHQTKLRLTATSSTHTTDRARRRRRR